MFDRFGEKGHDYQRVDDGSIQVDEAKVHEIMAQRLHARLSRNFVVADELRTELRRKYGVEMTDKDRTWMAVEVRSGGDRGDRSGGRTSLDDDDEDERGRGRGRGRDDDDDDDDDNRRPAGRSPPVARSPGRADDADDDDAADADAGGGAEEEAKPEEPEEEANGD